MWKKSLNTLLLQRLKSPLSWGILLVWLADGYFVSRQILQKQQLKNVYLEQIAQLRELKQAAISFPDFLNMQQQDLIQLNYLTGLFATSEQTTQAVITISNQLVQSGLQIKLFQPDQGQMQARLIHFQVSGTYLQLIEFLHANNRRWPLNSIVELNIVHETIGTMRLLVTGVLKICGGVDKSGLVAVC